MRLVTFIANGTAGIGLYFNDLIIELDSALKSLAASGKIQPRCRQLPRSLKELIASEDALYDARGIFDYCLGGGEIPQQASTALDSVQLAPPVTDPGKILCLGGNYRKHCDEAEAEVPKNPDLFVKFSSALTGHRSAVIKPIATNMLDYEAELVVVIGRCCKSVSPDQAYDYIFGYTIMNDISARDIQQNDRQWTRAKGFETFAPMGPWIVTRDEIADPNNLGIKMLINGETMQDSNTGRMVFDIAQTVSFISQIFPLEPGDLISTGTPEGVGLYQDPPRLLREGDRMQVVIEKIGTLENRVVYEKASGPLESWRQRPPETERDNIFGS